jgi:maleate isomerase
MTIPAAIRRIGVVVPSVNTVIEGWYPYALPADVRLVVNRMLIAQTVTAQSLREMDGFGVEAARTLATARPGVVIYGCTASSLVGGRDYDLRLLEELREATGAAALTTTESVLRALAHLRVGTVAVASPYTEELGQAEVQFLSDTGHPVLGHAHLGILGGFELASPSADDIARIARQAWHNAGGRADALFIGCMNLNSHLVIDSLEAELGVPVVTATQASLWAALRELGHSGTIPGYGRLLHGVS